MRKHYFQMRKARGDGNGEGGSGELAPKTSYPNFKTVGKKTVTLAGPFGCPWKIVVRVNKDGFAHPQDIPAWANTTKLFVGKARLKKDTTNGR